MSQPGIVALTVYMKNDLAEVSRILQVLVMQAAVLERISASRVPVDTRAVPGLERVQEPVMRLMIVAAVVSDREVERLTKALNRLVEVYKVMVMSSEHRRDALSRKPS